MNILELYENLSTMKGTNDKIKLIADNKDNIEFIRFLQVVYDPKYNFFMTLTKKDVNVEEEDIDNYSDEKINEFVTHLTNRLLYIAKHNKRGLKEKEDVIDFINSIHNFKLREMMMNAVNRNLKVGVSIKSINKALGYQLIEEVPYMRCSTKNDSNWDKLEWSKGVIVQLKADGSFVNALRKGGTWTFRTRNGSSYPIDAFPIVSHYLDSLVDGIDNIEEYVISGEMLVLDEDYNILDRSTGNGVLNSMLQTGGRDMDKPVSFRFVVWDIYRRDYENDKSTYNERFNFLQDMFQSNQYMDFETKFSHLSLIDTHVVYNPEDAVRITNDWMANGFEGSIVKNPDAKFKNGTSKDFIKMKVDFDCDLQVTGFIEGKGKNEETFGSLVCQSRDGKLTVNVSGFTDKQRKDIWEDMDNVIDKIITVKSNGIIDNRISDGKSLYLPRFVEFRLDKDTADDLNSIYEQYNSLFK